MKNTPVSFSDIKCSAIKKKTMNSSLLSSKFYISSFPCTHNHVSFSPPYSSSRPARDTQLSTARQVGMDNSKNQGSATNTVMAMIQRDQRCKPSNGNIIMQKPRQQFKIKMKRKSVIVGFAQQLKVPFTQAMFAATSRRFQIAPVNYWGFKSLQNRQCFTRAIEIAAKIAAKIASVKGP